MSSTPIYSITIPSIPQAPGTKTQAKASANSLLKEAELQLKEKKYDNVFKTAQLGLNRKSPDPEMNQKFRYLRGQAMFESNLFYGAMGEAIFGLQIESSPSPTREKLIQLAVNSIFEIPRENLLTQINTKLLQLENKPDTRCQVLHSIAQKFFTENTSSLATLIAKKGLSLSHSSEWSKKFHQIISAVDSRGVKRKQIP